MAEIGEYSSGWRPESSLREVANEMLDIVFSRDATDIEFDMALSTLWEAIDPRSAQSHSRRRLQRVCGVMNHPSGDLP